MAQQTSVEWLVEQLLDGKLLMPSLIEQAKAMEKQQILNASRQFADYPFDENDIQQYYTETYNK
jgi:hypothetical protein